MDNKRLKELNETIRKAKEEKLKVEAELARLKEIEEEQKLKLLAPLEEKFTKLVDAGTAEIRKYTDEAKALLEKAMEASEKTGIPIDEGISFVRNTYVPKSFTETMKEFQLLYEHDIAQDILGVGSETYPGCWQHSNSICW